MAKPVTPLDYHALKIVGKKADAVRDKLVEGAGQAVDLTVRIAGAISVGANVPEGTTTAVEYLSHEVLLTLVLSRLSERKQAEIARDLVTACKPYLAGGPLPVALPSDVRRAQQLASSLTRSKEVTTAGRHGAVSGSLSIEVIERAGKVLARAA